MAPVAAREATAPNTSGESNATLAVSGLVIGLAVAFTALRIYVRIFTKAGVKLDDCFILISVLATLATAALLLYGNSVDPNGLWVSENTDSTYIYTPGDHAYLKLAFSTSVLYFTIAYTTKQGILLMYNRIFSVSASFRYQLYLASFLVTGWWIGCTAATLTNCIPLKWSWLNSLADPEYCFDYNIFWMASGAVEIFLDAMILAIPISVVARMQLSLKRRLTIVGIFLLGGFILVTGIVRVILGYPPGSRVPSYSKTEIWTTIHAGMSIVCASLPIFGPLIRKIAKSSIVTGISRSTRSFIQPRLRTITESKTSTLAHSVGGGGCKRTRSRRHGDWKGGCTVQANGSMSLQLTPLAAVDRRSQSLVAQWIQYLERSRSGGMPSLTNQT